MYTNCLLCKSGCDTDSHFYSFIEILSKFIKNVFYQNYVIKVLQSSRSFENQVIKFQLHETAKIRMSKLQPAHRSFFAGLNEVQWALDFRIKKLSTFGQVLLYYTL